MNQTVLFSVQTPQSFHRNSNLMFNPSEHYLAVIMCGSGGLPYEHLYLFIDNLTHRPQHPTMAACQKFSISIAQVT